MRVPTDQTLAKYGLSKKEWASFLTLDKDGNPICPICERFLDKPVTDHKHVPRYKTFPPEVRKQYVRGITCIACNHYVLTRFANAIRHTNAAKYITDFERRFAKWEATSSSDA
jgi:hypothetical protein